MYRPDMEVLARPFPPALINPPPKGKFGSSVAHDVVTQKLLSVCGGFDFEIREVIYGPEHNVEAIIARMTLIYDGVTHVVDEIGDVEFPAQKHTQGERLKDAASDAIKRCAMRFGVALHLWSGEQFFLHAQLKKQNQDALLSPSSSLGEHPVRDGDTAPPPPSPAQDGVAADALTRETQPESPPPGSASPLSVRKLQERVAALQAAGVKIADARKELGLPLLNESLAADVLPAWDGMLTGLEESLPKPEPML